MHAPNQHCARPQRQDLLVVNDDVVGDLPQGYEWFTEGFDTRDLKDAKALLEELEG
jgi:hypothetical protein